MREFGIKVLYILHLSTKYTGANKSALNMLEGVRSQGIHPLVVLPQMADMTMANELEKLGIEYVVLNYFMPVYAELRTLKDKLYFLPKLARARFVNCSAKKRLEQLITARGIELIHTNVGPLLLGHEVAAKVGIPHVWHLREFQDLDFRMNTWYSMDEFRKLLNNANTFPIAISKAVYNHFRLTPPASIIYNGIMKSADKQFVPRKESYFLYVGFLSESKGLFTLLEGFAAFVKVHTGYRLLIAGVAPDPFFLKKIQQFVWENDMHELVQFLGHRDDISVLMSNATALVVPSFNEAFGRTTAEAMINGCLVIGKNAAGTKEIIERVGFGILYDNEQTLVAALNEAVALVESEHTTDNLKAAAEKALLLFSIESNVHAVLDYYKYILECRLDEDNRVTNKNN